MRLDQFLVKSNICSRSEAKKLIKSGRVCVNGSVYSDSSKHIDEINDSVTLDGDRISYEEFHYYMLNKPAGCVSATQDRISDTVLDILKGENVRECFPVGRLDKDTEGLLLISDDGKLAHRLLSPKFHVDKTYYVIADNKLSDEECANMEQGLDIGDEEKTMPAVLIYKGEHCDSEFCYELTIREGRFHQVKRMFEQCGSKVIYLKRLSMGPLKLDDNLECGEFRRLSEAEISALKSL